jgi:hypothetical protein
VADQLASPSDLASLLQKDVDTASATLAIEVCTAVVQAAADGQRIVQVVGDTATVTGTTEQWLRLPQWPVTAVSLVALDGTALTAGLPGSGASTYRLVGDRLYRGSGWQTYCGEPSTVSFTFTHGYATGDQRLQLGRGAVLSLGRGLFENPSGVISEKIDDYAVAYAAADAALDASPALKAAIQKQYGPKARMVRIL